MWGQLGDGDAGWRTNPVRVAGLKSVAAIAGGRYHSVVALSDGSIWTFGCNLHGQLGIGTTDSRPHPTPARVQWLPAKGGP